VGYPLNFGIICLEKTTDGGNTVTGTESRGNPSRHFQKVPRNVARRPQLSRTMEHCRVARPQAVDLFRIHGHHFSNIAS